MYKFNLHIMQITNIINQCVRHITIANAHMSKILYSLFSHKSYYKACTEGKIMQMKGNYSNKAKSSAAAETTNSESA